MTTGSWRNIQRWCERGSCLALEHHVRDDPGPTHVEPRATEPRDPGSTPGSSTSQFFTAQTSCDVPPRGRYRPGPHPSEPLRALARVLSALIRIDATATEEEPVTPTHVTGSLSCSTARQCRAPGNVRYQPPEVPSSATTSRLLPMTRVICARVIASVGSKVPSV